MIFLWVTLAVLTIFCAGVGLTLSLWRGAQPILAMELFGLAWLLGAGCVSAVLAVAGIFLSGGALFTVTTIVTVFLGWVGVRRLMIRRVSVVSGCAGAPVWEKWLGAVVLIPILYMGWASFRDALAWDGLLLWESKARHAFLSGGTLPASYFQDPARTGYHPNYPLYLPYTELWVYLWVGSCHQTAVKVLFGLFHAAGLALLWSNTRRLGGKVWVAALTALLPLFIPLMADHGLGLVQGYADFLLGAVYLAAVGALFAWRFQRVEAGWPIAIACATLLPWIKQDGILLVASLLVQAVLLQPRGWREWKQTAVFALSPLAVAGIWQIAMRWVQTKADSDFVSLTGENLMASLPRIGPILYLLGDQLSLVKNWNLLWWVIPLALVCLAWRQRRREALCLTLALVVPLALDVLPYLLTRLDLVRHVATSLERLVLQIALVAVLCLGLALAANGRPSTRPDQPID